MLSTIESHECSNVICELSEASGGGSEFGQGDAEGGDRKKRPELVDRRTDANWLRMQYGASERRVCGLADNHSELENFCGVDRRTRNIHIICGRAVDRNTR
jgi:hypothetical protein